MHQTKKSTKSVKPLVYETDVALIGAGIVSISFSVKYCQREGDGYTGANQCNTHQEISIYSWKTYSLLDSWAGGTNHRTIYFVDCVWYCSGWQLIYYLCICSFISHISSGNGIADFNIRINSATSYTVIFFPVDDFYFAGRFIHFHRQHAHVGTDSY